MYQECLVEWDQLVEDWELFEQKGLNPQIIQEITTPLAGPLAVVGSGRGLMLEHFSKLLQPENVWGFDTSPKMVEIAQKRGFPHVVLVSPEKPIPVSLSFQSIVISTGVLDPLEPKEIVELLTAWKQHLQPDGVLVFVAFSREGEIFRYSQKIGADTELGSSVPRFFQLCREYIKEGDWKNVLEKNQIVFSQEQEEEIISPLKGAFQGFSTLAEKKNKETSEVLDWLESISPKIERAFRLSDLLKYTQEAELNVAEQITLEGIDLHIVVCQASL